MSLRVSVLPEFESFRHGETHGAFVVVVHPPPAPAQRPPVDIVLSLDISRSMTGGKLRAAVDCASALVKGLRANDTLACIVFGRSAAELVAPTRMTEEGKRWALSRLESVCVSAGTNLESGMLRALEMANRMGSSARVLLMTDGQPSVGTCAASQLLVLARGALGSATLSTFGYGPDSDSAFLGTVADLCRGNYTFVDRGELPMHAIGAEVGGLMRTVVAGATLAIQPSGGAQLERVYRTSGVYHDRINGAALELPSLVAGEPQSIGIELSWPGPSMPDSLGLVTLTGRSTEDGGELRCSCAIVGRSSPHRGAIVRDAEKQLILARCAHAVELAIRAKRVLPEAVATALSEQRAALSAAAAAARLQDDLHVTGALAMMQDAQLAIANAGESGFRDIRHQVLGVSRALRTMRGTIMVPRETAPTGHDAFMTASQRAGINSMTRWSLLPGPGKSRVPKRTIIVEAASGHEPDISPEDLN